MLRHTGAEVFGNSALQVLRKTAVRGRHQKQHKLKNTDACVICMIYHDVMFLFSPKYMADPSDKRAGSKDYCGGSSERIKRQNDCPKHEMVACDLFPFE